MLVEKTDYGLIIKLHDKMKLEELKEVSAKVEPILFEYKAKNKKFSILLDLSEVKIQDPAIMEEMGKGMILAKEAGTQRTAIIFSSSIAKLQVANKAREAGIYNSERYFSVTEEDYKKNALAWAKNGVEPK